MLDVVARLSGPLAPGSDAHAVIRFHGGGSAANTAAWLAAAGAEPVLVGTVGDDERGREARAGLVAHGVDARLAVDPELPTGTCLVLVGPGVECGDDGLRGSLLLGAALARLPRLGRRSGAAAAERLRGARSHRRQRSG